MEWLHSHR